MDVRELVERVLATVNGNQAELARRLGRSETTISRWANGKTGIDYESALRIVRMTGLPPREVLEAANLDPELFPVVSAQRADVAKVEWASLYDLLSPEHRPTITAMVRAAANAAGDTAANPPGKRLNNRRRGQQPPFQSHKRELVGANVLAACASILTMPLRWWHPLPESAAATA